MNEYCLARLSREEGATDNIAAAAERARAVVGNALIGVVMFGSLARGSASIRSDVDLLLVIERSVAITRELYRGWDVEPVRIADRVVDAHFVHLPNRRVAGGVWAEAAVDGIPKMDRDHRIHEALAAIRRDMADGVLRRHSVHGQSYWTTGTTAA